MGLQDIGVDVMDELCLLSFLLSEQPDGLLGSKVERKIKRIDQNARKDLHKVLSTFIAIWAASASR